MIGPQTKRKIIDPYTIFYQHFLFLMGISMCKWPNFEYHVGKRLKYDRSGYNSSHPSLGSPLDLGNPWRPLATCLKMTILWKTWGVVAASRNPMLLRLETPRFSPVFFTPPLSKEFFRRSKNSRKNQLIPNFTGKREIFSLTCPVPQIFPLSRPLPSFGR